MKFNVIILAGGEKGPLHETTGYVEKALLPIHGKPMVSRVIEAFDASSRVENIVVVGSSKLDELEAMRRVRKRLPAGSSVVQNLLLAIGYVKHRLYGSASHHDGYVVSFCDAVFLTPAIIDATLETVEAAGADIVLHYVERSAFEEAGLPTERTYLPVGDRLFTGTTLYYVRAFSKVLAAIPRLAQLRKHRKDPQKVLELIGCAGTDLPQIEATLGAELSATVKIAVSPHPELGLDVDKPADLALAEKMLEP